MQIVTEIRKRDIIAKDMSNTNKKNVNGHKLRERQENGNRKRGMKIIETPIRKIVKARTTSNPNRPKDNG